MEPEIRLRNVVLLLKQIVIDFVHHLSQIESIRSYKQHTNALMDISKKGALSREIWIAVEEMYIILKPIKKFTIELQGANITASDFYLKWLSLKLDMESHKENELAKSILKGMENRSASLFNNPAYLSCIFLDPRCNLLLSDAEKMSAKKHILQLNLHMRGLGIVNITKTESNVDGDGSLRNRKVSVSPIEGKVRKYG